MSAYLQGIQRLEFSQLGLTPESEDIPGISIKGNFSSFETLDIAIAGKGRISLAPLAEKVFNLGRFRCQGSDCQQDDAAGKSYRRNT